MPPLKAADLHRTIRSELGSAFTAMGFRRTPKVSSASWIRAEGDQWLVVWFQPSQASGPDSPGFKFTMEFQLGRDAAPGGQGHRQRMPALLDDAGREELRQLTNRAIAKLPPPNQRFAALLDPATRSHWLSGWELRTTPIGEREDVWMRQGDSDDVRAITSFIGDRLPALVERFLNHAWVAPSTSTGSTMSGDT